VVFVTHMEHHSNHNSWLETIAEVEIIAAAENGNVDIDHLRELLQKFNNRKNKIAAITACSNVTGIQTPYHEIAKIMHQHGGFCFADLATSAPYVNIDMHPVDPLQQLDAIYFSPHKFLGGPGSPGALIFNKKLYRNTVPDQPGGGTIMYSNPWRSHLYVADIEQREDGGTPPILQAVKAAMCIKLKDQMGVERIQQREVELLRSCFQRLKANKKIKILEEDATQRLGIISFIVEGAHHQLVVKLLNDKFGIQTRGGCSCAGTYGHRLMQVDQIRSYQILNSIRKGDLLAKPGWVRLSLHPTMTNSEVEFILDAIESTVKYFEDWGRDYVYDPAINEYVFKTPVLTKENLVTSWFEPGNWG
ncbi:MAG TPA: aminotransferase class V-fold PLP-dependent enzyme, partial [Ferruginibacter sp.]|nr:aminotransferase class V-fold PLP-dependent enzyme [Ferruginibacter sp.]